MTTFQYQAMKISDRAQVSGVISAESEREAREMLREQDLIPTKLNAVKTARPQGPGLSWIDQIMSRFTEVGSKELITFTRNMAMMNRSGIPLTEALLYFENYAKNPKFKVIISQIRQDILNGMSFHQALAKHELFNQVYVNVTKAGESSGELDATLSRLAEVLGNSEKLKMKVVSACVYPMIVLFIMVLVLLVMFLWVIPTFVDIFEQMGLKLPLITQIMVAISRFMTGAWYIFFPLVGVSCYGLFKYFTSASGRAVVDRVMLKMPVLGELVKYIANAQFVSTFHVSFSAGLPITEALQLSVQTIGHSEIRQAFQRVNTQIQAGQGLGVSLAQTGKVPELVLLMISSGEESGELDRMLKMSLDHLEEEVNHRVGILTTMLEPLLMLVLGVVVGFVALSIYMPMFSMYEGF